MVCYRETRLIISEHLCNGERRVIRGFTVQLCVSLVQFLLIPLIFE